MRDKKIRLDGTTSRRAEVEKTTGRTSVSVSYSNTSTVPGQLAIADLLGHGRQNAVPLKQLVSITGLSERAVRLKIALERKHGALILSDNSSGYYLPSSPDDLRRFAHSMAHRAGEIAAVARLAEAAVAEAEGQETLCGW